MDNPEFHKRLSLFPLSTAIADDQLTLQGYRLQDLATQYGTPLYIYDAATLEHHYAAYVETLQHRYPAPFAITYAGKAYLSPRLIHWLERHGAWIDCSSHGEILTTRESSRRVPILVHGVNKSPLDLEHAIRHAQVIVVDNPSELQRLIACHKNGAHMPDLWLRFQPGIAPHTHSHIQTGHHESKFGMTTEELLYAVKEAQHNGLSIRGLHFHIGSQFRETSSLCAAIEQALDLAAQIFRSEEWHFSPGGGWGVPYHENDLPWPPIETYLTEMIACILKGVRARGLPLPYLHVEPGRSLIAQAGLAIYRIGTIKRRPSRTWLLADGGMADNPRPALYGARYTALPLRALSRPWDERVWIGGPYCESGDVLIEDLLFPTIEEGEYIAIPVSGAYQLSMASNYNGAARPAVLWIEKGKLFLNQKREHKIWWK